VRCDKKRSKGLTFNKRANICLLKKKGTKQDTLLFSSPFLRSFHPLLPWIGLAINIKENISDLEQEIVAVL